MRRIIGIWTGVSLTLGAFFLWHTPLRPPLSPNEIRTALQSMNPAAAGVADPSKVLAFLEADDGRPFYMVNVLTFAAASPDDASPASSDPAAAHQRYSRAVLPMLLARGAYPVMVTSGLGIMANTYGDVVDPVDQVAIVRYRSRRDLLDMIISDDFAAAVPDKWASLTGTVAAPSTLTIGVGLAPVVVVLLVGGGLIATFFVAGRRTTRSGG